MLAMKYRYLMFVFAYSLKPSAAKAAIFEHECNKEDDFPLLLCDGESETSAWEIGNQYAMAANELASEMVKIPHVCFLSG